MPDSTTWGSKARKTNTAFLSIFSQLNWHQTLLINQKLQKWQLRHRDLNICCLSARINTQQMYHMIINLPEEGGKWVEPEQCPSNIYNLKMVRRCTEKCDHLDVHKLIYQIQSESFDVIRSLGNQSWNLKERARFSPLTRIIDETKLRVRGPCLIELSTQHMMEKNINSLTTSFHAAPTTKEVQIIFST